MLFLKIGKVTHVDDGDDNVYVRIKQDDLRFVLLAYAVAGFILGRLL
ncbi:MAG: hypothetical protein ABL893_10825 [Hyphomicrobium sp.]